MAEAVVNLAGTLAENSSDETALREAEALADAVALLRGTGPEYRDDLVRALIFLSDSQSGQEWQHGPRGGRHPGQSLALAREALAAAGDHLSPQMAEAVVNLAGTLAENSSDETALREAEALADKGLALTRATHPSERHSAVADAFFTLASIRNRRRDGAGAEACYRDALRIYRQTYGDIPHSTTVATLGILLELLDSRWEGQAADAVRRDCEAAWKVEPYKYPSGDYIAYIRALKHVERGDYTGAERFARLAQSLAAGRIGRESGLAELYSRFWLGNALYFQGRPAEARAAFGDLLERAREVAAGRLQIPGGEERANRWVPILAANGNAEDWDTGERLCRRRLDELAAPSTGAPPNRPDDPDKADCLVGLAIIQAARGNHAAVVQNLPAAILRYERRHGPQVVRMAEDTLAGSQAALGDWKGVELTRRSGLARALLDYPDGHPEIADRRIRLAEFLAGRQRNPEAEPELVAARDLLAAHPHADDPDIVRRRAEVYDRLIAGAVAGGKPAEAAKWRAERAGLPLPPELLPAPRTAPQ